MASAREFWGLDFETSGTSHDRHVPIQLGLTAPNGDTYTSLIGGWHWRPECGDLLLHGKSMCSEWDEQAFAIHGITQEQLTDAPKPAHVTNAAVDFIMERSDAWKGERKLVGWNVASFDVPFLRKYLPGLAAQLSYQSVDLNAVCFAISQAHGTSYKALKSRSKDYAAEQLADTYPDALWHDAGYDAAAALHSFDYLTGRIKEGY